MQRMNDMAEGQLPHARPLLLFPEGTTTNGRYLLPFKTGAFLAGQPLQPVVIRYGQVRRRRGLCRCWFCTRECRVAVGLCKRGRCVATLPWWAGRPQQPHAPCWVYEPPCPLAPAPPGPLLPGLGDDPGGAAHLPDHGQPGEPALAGGGALLPGAWLLGCWVLHPQPSVGGCASSCTPAALGLPQVNA